MTTEREKAMGALRLVQRWFEQELLGHPNRKNTYRQILLDKVNGALEYWSRTDAVE